MYAFDNRILGLEIASLKGGLLFIGPDGSALHDSFDVLDAVDLSQTENVDFSEGGVIKNITPSGTPIIPDMSNNTSPSPFVASSSDSDSWSGGGSNWNAFDRNNSTGWYDDTEPAWLAIDCGTQKNVGGFSIRSRHNYSENYNGFPVEFGVYGSNNGTDWVLIDSFSGLSWVNGETKSFTFSSHVNYRHYKLNVTDGSTNNVIISEWQLYPPETAQDVTIVSSKISSSVVPSKIRCAVLAVHSGVLNTDFNVFLSRDDGATWEKATAIKLYDNQDGFAVIDTGDVDVTGQPSGSDLRYKIETANGITCTVDGVAMWGEA